jgi:hypothetical protein
VDAVTMRDINELLEGKAESDLGKIQPKVVAFEKPEPLPVVDAFKGSSGNQDDLDSLLEDVDPSEPAPAKNTDVSIDDLLDFI